MHVQQLSLCGGHVCRNLYSAIAVLFSCNDLHNVREKCMCNTHLNLESLSCWCLLANVPLFTSNEVSFRCSFFSPPTEKFSFCCWDHLVFALSCPSVLWNNHGWVGCLTTLGSGLQRRLSPGGAIKLCGGVWQGSVCHAGPRAGEGPGGTILCTPEEPACSAGHWCLCAPTTGALPQQTEGFKHCCCQSVRRWCVNVGVCWWDGACLWSLYLYFSLSIGSVGWKIVIAVNNFRSVWHLLCRHCSYGCLARGTTSSSWLIDLLKTQLWPFVPVKNQMLCTAWLWSVL